MSTAGAHPEPVLLINLAGRVAGSLAVPSCVASSIGQVPGIQLSLMPGSAGELRRYSQDQRSKGSRGAMQPLHTPVSRQRSIF
ncbi:MAG: hypothetical protein Q8L74_00185 [Nitrospirota bacterium]|nr:hypothetical protein [Nitrospirota bacterium]